MKKVLTFILSLGMMCPMYASLYDQAWEALTDNDCQKAEQLFRQSVEQEPEKAADAWLSMYLMFVSDGRPDKAFSCFENYYSVEPNADMAYMVLSNDGVVSADDGARQLEFITKAAKTEHAIGTLDSELAEHLAHYYWGRKNKGKYKEWSSKIVCVDHWQILGSFDNTSSSGFDKNFGALEHPEASAEFDNRVGCKVKWYEADFSNHRGWFHLEDVFGTNVIVYAQSFVNSPVEQDLVLSVGTSGSLKAWVNDGLVMVEEEERNCGDDTYLTKVHLNAGYNRILIQLGNSEISGLNFKVRFTDETFHPVRLSSTAKFNKYIKAAANGGLKFIERPQETYFKARYAQDPSPLNTLMLARCYLYSDKKYEALEILEELEKQYPKSTVVAYNLLDGYNRSDNDTDCSRVREGIRHNDPEGFFGMYLRCTEAYDTDNYLEAEQLVEALKKKNPVDPDLEILHSKILVGLNKEKESRSVIQQAYAKYPENVDIVAAYYVQNLSTMSNPESILESYLKKIDNPKLASELVDIYIEKSKTYSAYSTASNLVKRYPENLDYLRDLVVVCYRMQAYSPAIKYCEEGLKLAPYSSWFHSTLAYLYAASQSHSPFSSLEQAIRLNPKDYDARMNLRHFRKKEEVFGALPYSIDSLISVSPKVSESSNDKYVTLLRDNAYVYYEEGASEMRTTLLAKVMNQAGVEYWSDIKIYGEAYGDVVIDKVDLIKPNGQHIKGTQDENHVVFTNIEPGDCIHIVYRTRYYYPLWQSKCVDECFRFQTDENPVLISRLSMQVPKDYPLNYSVYATTATPEKSVNDEGQDVYVWELRGLPRIVAENNVLWRDNLPSIYLSSIASWRTVQDWYADITKNKLKSDYIVRNTLREILEGKENASEFEKTHAIYDYVAGKITYSSASFLHGACIPQRASNTLVTRLGDCKDVSTLFVTLCREAGIKADLVLVSTRDRGVKCMPLPSRMFNHCMARVWLDGKKYYLELTNNYLPFTAIPEADFHAKYLPIDDSSVDQLQFIDAEHAIAYALKRYLKVSVDGPNLNMHYEIDYIGEKAANIRSKYRHKSDEFCQKEVLEGISSWYEGITKISNLKFEHLDDLDSMVVRNVDVTIENYVQKVADMQLLQLPWISRLNDKSLVAGETRNFELCLWGVINRNDFTQMTVQLPAGKQFVEMPKSVVFRCNGAEYRVKVEKLSQNRVRLTRKMTCSKDFLPTSDYPEFRKFYTDIMNYEAKQYVIK